MDSKARDRFVHGYDVVVKGKKQFREPQITEEDKKLVCIRASREQLLWAHTDKLKPCTNCTGVEYGNWTGLKELVDDIQAGVKRPECQRCWNDEAEGFPSYRQQGNQQWKIPGHGNSHTEIIYNNNCNASCLYCSGTQSSVIAEEIKNTEHKVPTHLLNSNEAADPPLSKEKILESAKQQVANIAKDINKLACIGVYGGEPSLDIIEEDHIGILLEEFFKHNQMWTRTIRYDFNSNFQFSEERAKQLVEYFHYYSDVFPTLNIIIQPSMECMGKFYNFVRHGCDWEIAERNLNYFLQNTNLQVDIRAHINNVSLKNLAPFLERMNNKCRDIRPFYIEIDFVNRPEIFSNNILDSTFKKYSNDVWFYLENNQPHFANIDAMVTSLKMLNKMIDSSPEHAKKFYAKQALETYDYFKKTRGVDLLEVNPELYYYFKMVNISSN